MGLKVPGSNYLANRKIIEVLFCTKVKLNTYLLIDTWNSKQAYEDFKKLKQDAYNELSSKFEYLYDTEEKIGSYDLVVP